jgi:hypothetical protein
VTTVVVKSRDKQKNVPSAAAAETPRESQARVRPRCRPTPAADTAKNKTIGHEPDTLPANQFARAAVDPNARKEARKSLDRRQAVDTTSTAPSGKPGRIPAGGLTKDTSFGHESSGGRT